MKHLELCQRIREAGGQPYLVGGFVRDSLLGRSPKDVDIVVVGMTWQQLCDTFVGCDLKVVGNSFPVCLVDGIEIASARTERKTGEGYTGFVCEVENVTLEEDLMRRDLTINAMAIDPFTNEIIDPFHGIRDLRQRLLNPVGRQFGEDPLRVLRAARFAAQLDMNVSAYLVQVAERVLPELITLPGERIWGELEKALRTERPSLFFEALNQLGALEIVFPEIHALKGRVQPEKYHPEGDAYVHTLLVLQEARRLGADDETMFAALVHDLGKAVTPDDNLPHHYNHEALGVPLVNAMCDRLRVPNPHRKVGIATAREHLNVHNFMKLRPTTQVRLLMRLGVIQNDMLARRVVMASKADARGRGPLYADNPYPQGDSLIEAARVIRQVRGDQFVHLKDGKKIAAKMEQERTKLLQKAEL